MTEPLIADLTSEELADLPERRRAMLRYACFVAMNEKVTIP